MSVWIEIKDKDSLDISDDGKDLEIFVNQDDFGANYYTVPLDLIDEVIGEYYEKWERLPGGAHD